MHQFLSMFKVVLVPFDCPARGAAALVQNEVDQCEISTQTFKNIRHKWQIREQVGELLVDACDHLLFDVVAILALVNLSADLVKFGSFVLFAVI